MDKMTERAREIALREHPVCDKYIEDCDIYRSALKALQQVRDEAIEECESKILAIRTRDKYKKCCLMAMNDQVISDAIVIRKLKKEGA